MFQFAMSVYQAGYFPRNDDIPTLDDISIMCQRNSHPFPHGFPALFSKHQVRAAACGALGALRMPEARAHRWFSSKDFHGKIVRYPAW